VILRLALCLALVTTAHGAAGSEGLPASGMSLFSQLLADVAGPAGGAGG